MNIKHPSTAKNPNYFHKLLVLVFGALFLTIVMGLFAPASVNANHDTCDDKSPQVYLRCKDTRRTTAQVLCYENNKDKNAAIATCVVGVTAHFDPTGSGSVPPLPDDALPDGTASSNKGSQTEADFKKCNDATSKEDGCVAKYISTAIAFLSGGVGIVVVIMIIIGGIQYTSSSGDPQKVGAAKQKIFNAVLALVAWVLLLGFLNYLVPGGLF